MKELNEARVLAVGPGGLDKEGKRVLPSVAAGDKVLIPQVRQKPEQTFCLGYWLTEVVVWRQSCEGWRRRVLAVQRSRVSVQSSLPIEFLS